MLKHFSKFEKNSYNLAAFHTLGAIIPFLTNQLKALKIV
jgi:hypothetical protein